MMRGHLNDHTDVGRTFGWIAWLLLLGGLVASLVVSLQDRLLYFPSKVEVAELEATGLRPWPSAEAFRGLMVEPTRKPNGTVVVFHGNAGHVGQRAFYADQLEPRGLRVILAEYPGYGPREGPLGEASLVADASDTIGRAYAMYGAPLLVVGESLGSGVAAAAVGRQQSKVAGVLLITPWNRLEEVAKYHFPWLPVGWFLRDRYDSEKSLRGFSGPVEVVVAERDQTVPPATGLALYGALSGPKRLTVVKNADHNDWRTNIPSSWWGESLDFLFSR